jgi:hypothetical protein
VYDYVIVPYTSQFGSGNAEFEVRLYTDKHSLRCLQPPHIVTVGGVCMGSPVSECMKYSNWSNNPQYALSIFRPESIFQKQNNENVDVSTTVTLSIAMRNSTLS